MQHWHLDAHAFPTCKNVKMCFGSSNLLTVWILTLCLLSDQVGKVLKRFVVVQIQGTCLAASQSLQSVVLWRQLLASAEQHKQCQEFQPWFLQSQLHKTGSKSAPGQSPLHADFGNLKPQEFSSLNVTLGGWGFRKAGDIAASPKGHLPRVTLRVLGMVKP